MNVYIHRSEVAGIVLDRCSVKCLLAGISPGMIRKYEQEKSIETYRIVNMKASVLQEHCLRGEESPSQRFFLQLVLSLRRDRFPRCRISASPSLASVRKGLSTWMKMLWRKRQEQFLYFQKVRKGQSSRITLNTTDGLSLPLGNWMWVVSVCRKGLCSPSHLQCIFKPLGEI